MTEVLIKVGFLAAVALNGAIIFTIMDVKGASWMQRRPGPLHVGLRGFIFPLAEILKFVQKEDISQLKLIDQSLNGHLLMLWFHVLHSLL